MESVPPVIWTEEELVNLIETEMTGTYRMANRFAVSLEVIRGLGHVLADRRYGQSDRIMAAQRVIGKWREVTGLG